MDSTANRCAPYASLNAQPSLAASVVVCTRNRARLLRKCLEAIAHLDPPPCDILVVDNSAGDDETKRAAAAIGARYTREPARGLSRARNRGLAECDSDIVVYLDDDCIPAPDWLGILMAPFTDSRVAATTGRIVTPHASIETKEVPRAVSNQTPRWFEIATFGGIGLGGNMALRLSACRGQVIFDQRLGRGAPLEIGEESYAFGRLISMGHRVVYLPSAIVFHPELRRVPVEHEARNAFAYWLLLLSEFPRQRIDLLRFLVRRLLRQPLGWPRDSQEPGEIIRSGWRVQLKAAWSGLTLFLRTPRDPSGS